MRYIFDVAGDEPVENLQQRILDAAPPTEKAMASPAEQLIQKGVQKGEAKGMAESILAVLETRGLAVSAEQRARILDCKDLAELDRWLRKAVTASTVAELFTH